MSALENILHFPTQARRQSNVNSWKWNELEEDVLDELPHACQIIYLRVMRKHMDYSTGIVGRVRRISYEQIKERLRYTPPPQSREKPVEYSTDQVKKLIRKLVNAGLLERLHDTSKGVQPMEFRLPLACTDADSQGHDRATVTGPRENPHGYGAGEHNRATTGPRKNASQGHPSGSGIPNTSSNEEVRIGAQESQPEKPNSNLPNCPHNEIIDLWAEIMPDKPQPSKNMWQGTERARHLAARWKAGFTIKHERTGEPLYTDLETGIAWWGRFFRFLRKSEFLMGDNRWFKLAWVAKRENFVKIMEMDYHDGGES